VAQLEIPSDQAGAEVLLSVVTKRVPARRHLKALVATAPEPLRAELRRGTWIRQAQACTALVAASSDPVEHRATVRALRLTAERALAAHHEARALTKELPVLAQAMAPALLAQPGVGSVTADQLLISWSYRGRLRSEAAFAMLAGVAPIPASSGRVVRYRLNRGGDRQLNRALHTPSSRSARPGASRPSAMWPAAPPRARADARSAAA
jgi:transposase